MAAESQNVTDYTNNNTIFMVWNFKENPYPVKTLLAELCKLVINLNNSANVRLSVSRLSIGHDAWHRLDLPDQLPKKLVNFAPVIGVKHTPVYKLFTNSQIH